MGDENKKPRMTNQELDDYVLNSFTDDIDFKQKQFFFQKRRGKLDLRAISKIDIDRVGKFVHCHLHINVSICPFITSNTLSLH